MARFLFVSFFARKGFTHVAYFFLARRIFRASSQTQTTEAFAIQASRALEPQTPRVVPEPNAEIPNSSTNKNAS